jgi:stress response protein YsnF
MEVIMAQTVVGFFDNQSEAQQAVERLGQCGISRDRIDVSRGSEGTSGSVGNDRNIIGDNPTADGRTVDDKGRNTNRITDFFNSLFGGGNDNDDANRYSRVAERAGAIVTVHARSNEEAEQAADILDDCGAVDVDERSAEYGYTNTRGTESTRQDISGDRDTTIPRIKEDLEVGKRSVETGGVRVRSRIVERPVEEHIRLREEHVDIERTAVNRPVSGDEFSNFQEGEIELTERAEVPVVNKEARVVEEVRVSKNVEQHDETIRDTVRETEVDIDKLNRGETRRDTDVDGLSDSNRNRDF